LFKVTPGGSPYQGAMKEREIASIEALFWNGEEVIGKASIF